MGAEVSVQWKEAKMSRTLSVPAVAEPLVDSIRQAKVFTRPTLPRFLLLMACVTVTMGRHTVSRALKAMGPLLEGHWSNYHRVYSRARYPMWKLAAVLVRQLLPLLPADQPVVLLADDTVDPGAPGPARVGQGRAPGPGAVHAH
jgi:hypothetical protein